MKVIVIGAGRMGIRHIQGILSLDSIQQVVVVDIRQEALINAESILKEDASIANCEFVLFSDLDKSKRYDVGIIASTANGRVDLFNLLVELGCKDIMVEKPLGQSYSDVCDFNDKVSKAGVNCCVNLNMRMYEGFIQLRDDFRNIPQLKGVKTISMNTGTIGIGANGIHYLDLLFFLLDADEAKIKAAHIDEKLIESPRGEEFADFGGWAVMDYLKQGDLKGTVFLSLSSRSTVFGSWEFVAPYGRIYLNEVEQRRTDTYRKVESELPLYRYFGDYMPPSDRKVVSPFLGELTAKWVNGLENGKQLLPTLSESLKVHKLMFDWLNHSGTNQEKFPIT